MATGSGSRGEIVRPDGATIAYDVAGDGPPVIFLHGLTNRRQGWDPVTSLLVPVFTCIRVDLRGHGESAPALDYSMPALVGDVRAVADELGVDAPAVIGSSLGANAAAVYAALNPARAVVCVGQSLLRFGDFAALVQPYARDLQGDSAMQAVLEIDRKLDLGPFEDLEAFERRVLAFPPEVVRGVWAQLLTVPPEELTAISEALLPAIAAPLLSLHGAQPPADYPSWLTRLVPTAEVEVWEGMGHLLHLVDPSRFAERVRSFLAPAVRPPRGQDR
jgi:pimeloyl-ACP methyl ester carboxylesterase